MSGSRVMRFQVTSKWWGALVAMAGLLAPAAADAQQANRLGFNIGEKSKLHLNLDLATMWDSNSLRLDDTDGADDYRLVVRPSLEVEVPGTQATLRLGLGATVSHYLGTGAASSDETLVGADGDIYLRLGSLKGPISFTLENSPMLTPTVLPGVGTIAADERLFPAFSDIGRAFITGRPGGGALEIDLGYENQFLIYNRDQGYQAPDDTFQHSAFIEGRLKFLPKTAVLLYGDFGWFDPSTPSGQPQTTLASNPYSVLLGFRGQITRTLSAEIRAGYGETLVWIDERFGSLAETNQQTVIGLASVTWEPIRTAKVSLAYERSVQPITALSSFISDAIRLRTSWAIDRLVLGLYSELQFRDFGTTPPDTAEATGAAREPFSTLVLGGARADYYFNDWLVGGLNYRLMIQDSNDESRAGALPQLGGFTRHQAIINLGVHY